MIRRLRAALDALVRLLLVLGLACSPLAQPLAIAAMAAPQPAEASACPHHTQAMQADTDHPKPGECCFKKGTPCHCAMTVALPATALSVELSTSTERPVSVPRLVASALPSPEPPPPRA